LASAHIAAGAERHTHHRAPARSSAPRAVRLRGDEVRALHQLRRQFPDSTFVFATERGGPFAAERVNRLIKRIGERAGFASPVHVHMLRHACGYALANAGHDTRRIQDWLGHRSIQHTTRNTQLSAAPFKDFWR
jgi:type 1 fimbriae regulatory protein FimB/type 1 fimbriae regulatory protein FimE